MKISEMAAQVRKLHAAFLRESGFTNLTGDPTAWELHREIENFDNTVLVVYGED